MKNHLRGNLWKRVRKRREERRHRRHYCEIYLFRSEQRDAEECDSFEAPAFSSGMTLVSCSTTLWVNPIVPVVYCNGYWRYVNSFYFGHYFGDTGSIRYTVVVSTDVFIPNPRAVSPDIKRDAEVGHRGCELLMSTLSVNSGINSWQFLCPHWLHRMVSHTSNRGIILRL